MNTTEFIVGERILVETCPVFAEMANTVGRIELPMYTPNSFQLFLSVVHGSLYTTDTFGHDALNENLFMLTEKQILQIGPIALRFQCKAIVQSLDAWIEASPSLALMAMYDLAAPGKVWSEKAYHVVMNEITYKSEHQQLALKATACSDGGPKVRVHNREGNLMSDTDIGNYYGYNCFRNMQNVFTAESTCTPTAHLGFHTRGVKTWIVELSSLTVQTWIGLMTALGKDNRFSTGDAFTVHSAIRVLPTEGHSPSGVVP